MVKTKDTSVIVIPRCFDYILYNIGIWMIQLGFTENRRGVLINGRDFQNISISRAYIVGKLSNVFGPQREFWRFVDMHSCYSVRDIACLCASQIL